MSGGTPRVAGFGDLEVIGRGGFSTVYSALQVDLGRRVAIKVLNFDVAEGAAQRRFERECKVVGILSGVPGVVAVHQSAFTDDGRPCIVMALMEGGTLQSHVRAEGPIGFEDARDLTEVLAEALAAAHAKDVVHRDIKPGNVLLSADRRPALADFGIAVVSHLAASSQTIESLSPPFAPPERLLGGEIDEKLADIYSLGATISFALTGVAPFGTAERGGVSGLVHRVLEDPPPELRGRGLPVEFTDLVTEMLDKRPDRRPDSPGEVLRRVLEIPGTPPAQPAVQAPKGRMPKQHGAPGQTDPEGPGVVIPPAPVAPAAVGFSLDPSGPGGDAPPPYNPPQDPDSHLGQTFDDDEYADSGVWPTAVDYVRAIQDRSTLLDADLAAATVREDMLGMPISAAGQSAVVFHVDSGGEPGAVRFFTRPPRDGRVRYRALADHMAGNPCDAVVSARWVESAIRIDDFERPAVWMPWAEGRPLNLALEDMLGDATRIESLAMIWLDVLDSLHGSQIAHGDLQNGNILVTDDLSVALVDLDGIWVPSLDGRPPAETGHLCFQHKARGAAHWGPEMDTFSGLLIFISLLALAADPQLWQFHQGENLILDAADLRRAGSTEAWQAMAGSSSPLVSDLTALLAEQAASASPPQGRVRDHVEGHGGTDAARLRERTPGAVGVPRTTPVASASEAVSANADWWADPALHHGAAVAGTPSVKPPVGSGPQIAAGPVWSSGTGVATSGSNASPAVGSGARGGWRARLANHHVASGVLIGLVAGVVASLTEAGAVQLFDVAPETSLLVLFVTAVATFCGLLAGWKDLLEHGLGRSWARILAGGALAGGVALVSAVFIDQAVGIEDANTTLSTGAVAVWAIVVMAVCLGVVGALRSAATCLTYIAAGLVGGALMAVPISRRGIEVLSDGSMVIYMSDAGGPLAIVSAMVLLGLAVGTCEAVVARTASKRSASKAVSP